MVPAKRLLVFCVIPAVAAALLLSGCDLRVFYGSPPDSSTVTDTTVLSVTLPDGTESYAPGDLLSVQWSGTVRASSVRIDLYRYGQLIMECAANAPNTGTYSWSIPSDFDAAVEITDDYRISVAARDPDHSPGELYYQAFSVPFSIVSAASDGLSDVTVSQRLVMITVTDNGQEIDGDTVDIILNGTVVATSHVLAAPPGTDFPLELERGANLLQIVAVNEGAVPPNTAQITITNVTEGEAVQHWRLAPGETGELTMTAP